MNRILKVVLIIFGILILLALIVGFYFYQFYVFKTLRVCVKQESSDLMIGCQTNDFCYDFIRGKAGNYSDEDLAKLPDFIKNKIKDSQNKAEALKETFEQLESAPEFLSKNINEIVEEILYCDSTCRYKEFYGSAPLGEGDVDSCRIEEKEFVLKIHGKEALKLAGWAKEAGLGMVVWDMGL